MKMTKTFLFSLLLILVLQPLKGQNGSSTVEGISIERLGNYGAFIRSEIDRAIIPGAVYMVYRHGEVVHEEAFGLSDMKAKEPMEEDAIFYIQSMTKPIISVAFMMLFEEGHFMLTDPVSKYLPAFKDLRVIKDTDEGLAGETVPLESEATIAQLLSHTAGFSHGLGSSPFDQEMIRRLMAQPFPDIATRVDTLLTMPLIGQPGKQWNYSFAPDVLSVLIQQFSGMPTDRFLQTRIFDPLGMKDTGYNLNAEQQSRLVPLHYVDQNGDLVQAPRQVSASGNTVWSGVNALFSTAADYLTFCQMLLHGGTYDGKQFLSPKTIELMTLNHSGDLFSDPGFGFGLGFSVIDDLAETRLPGSTGLYRWSGAYNTHFFIDPKEDLIGVFMTQTAPYDDRYQQNLRQMIYQAIVD